MCFEALVGFRVYVYVESPYRSLLYRCTLFCNAAGIVHCTDAIALLHVCRSALNVCLLCGLAGNSLNELAGSVNLIALDVIVAGGAPLESYALVVAKSIRNLYLALALNRARLDYRRIVVAR
mgnify:CR=1 FL=1